MRRPLLLAISVALIAPMVFASPVLAGDRRCTGTLGAGYVDGNVIVPAGATCRLRGTRIDGNVLVRRGAFLVAYGVKVDGNIQAEHHRRVVVTTRTVNDVVVRSRIGGDIQLFDGGSAEVRRAIIGGNLQVKSNSRFQEAVRNTIRGDLQAFDNDGGFRIYRNRIDGNLQCKSNVPRPYGGSNHVDGNKEDQCRRF
jgi:hypothetical protein